MAFHGFRVRVGFWVRVRVGFRVEVRVRIGFRVGFRVRVSVRGFLTKLIKKNTFLGSFFGELL